MRMSEPTPCCYAGGRDGQSHSHLGRCLSQVCPTKGNATASTCSARVCSPLAGGASGPTRSSWETKLYLPFPHRGGLWESPSQISAGRHSQTALLPDKSKLRQAEGKPPHKARSRSVGPPLASYPHTTALACPQCHSHPTAITPNCDSQGLLVERPTSQYWDCGCK